jgi:hypothetical protein
MTLYAAGRFGRLLDAAPPVVTSAPTSAPVSRPGTRPADMLERARAYSPQIRTAARITYAADLLVGTASALLLPMAMFVGVSVSLAGRLGGARSMIIGLFQALIIVLLLCPWHHWLELAALPIRGALCRFTEVDAALALPLEPGLAGAPELLRFLGLPFVTLLFLLAVTLRFRRGFRFALERVDPELRVRVI